MAKYKRWEERFLKSLGSRQAVRHSRKSFQGDRGVQCEECGSLLHPTHDFGRLGGWCVRCWIFFQVVEEAVMDGWGG